MAQTVILNIIPKGIPDVVYVSQYDAGRELIFKLYEGVSIYTIPANVSVIIGGKKGDNHTFAYTATIAQDRHSVSVETTEQMTACAGENLCQLRISKSGLDIATVNFRMIVQERPDASGDPSETDIPALVELAQQQVYDAEAWAKGTKNGIDVIPSDPQYNDHAKYWADVAEQWAEQFINGVVYKGSVLFANIPTTGMLNGWMYNITDAFTTDNRFKEGSGIYCEAGTNIIWNDAESLWDLAGGFGGVQSFNGRHGNILPQANDYDATQIKYGTNSNVNTELGNKADNITSFTEASTRANIASGETISTIFGKIKKWFTDLGTAAFKNVPASGDASTTDVVLGNDTRLTNARNAADVYSWAKASTKPSYTASEVGALPANGKANTAGTADKVAHHLTIGSINSIYFDGSHTAEVEIWNKIFCVEATGWSATVDSDGFYTQDIYPMMGSYIMYYDTDKPIIITIAGATENARPTSAEAAAYNMIDPTWHYPDNPQTDGSYFRFYTKTKPTSDFYVRIAGFHVNQV